MAGPHGVDNRRARNDREAAPTSDAASLSDCPAR